MGVKPAALFVNAGLKVKLLDIVRAKNYRKISLRKNLTIKLQISKWLLLFDLN
ncbi:hypothetical protein ACVPOY_03630 [Staphylococcus aureus]